MSSNPNPIQDSNAKDNLRNRRRNTNEQPVFQAKARQDLLNKHGSREGQNNLSKMKDSKTQTGTHSNAMSAR
ncbi:MAG TPA: hypothetical protein VFR94_23480 [Nitrososphaeraceae archaeon]|nr:hypothetical protein [Nitrososphaeraceae archaeon]